MQLQKPKGLPLVLVHVQVVDEEGMVFLEAQVLYAV